MKIGIVGAGRMAQAVGSLAVQAGHTVMLSNSRGPETIRDVGRHLRCDVGTVDQTAAYGEMIVAAVHLQVYRALPPDTLAGKLILDPQNYFPHFGAIPQIDDGRLTTAEVLARHLPKSRVVKALNAILVEDIVPDARPASAEDRRALPMAGDDDDAKAATAAFLDQIGYDTVDAGPLAEGWRFERRRPVYCVPLNKMMLEQGLTATAPGTLVADGYWRFERGIRALIG